MARAVAALPQAEKDFFDGLVANERAKVAEEERIAKLLAMPDKQAVLAAVNAGVTLKHRAHRPGNIMMDVDLDNVARVLREAGFVRHPSNTDISDAVLETVDCVVKVLIALDRDGGPYPHKIPGIRSELYRVVDALTGEDHSGNSPKLPPPPRRLVGREAIRVLRDELAAGGSPAASWETA